MILSAEYGAHQFPVETGSFSRDAKKCVVQPGSTNPKRHKREGWDPEVWKRESVDAGAVRFG